MGALARRPARPCPVEGSASRLGRQRCPRDPGTATCGGDERALPIGSGRTSRALGVDADGGPPAAIGGVQVLVAPEIRARAVERVRGGATFAEAAGEAGVSDFAVRKWCKSEGVRSARSVGGRHRPSRERDAAAGEGDRPPSEDGVACVVEPGGVALRAAETGPCPRPTEEPGAVDGSSAASEGDALSALLETVEEGVARRVRALAKREGRPVGQVLTRLLLEVLSRWE